MSGPFDGFEFFPEEKWCWGGGRGSDALEVKGPQRWPQRRLGRRLEEVAEAVGGRLLSVTNAVEALGVRETVAALGGGGGRAALEGKGPVPDPTNRGQKNDGADERSHRQTDRQAPALSGGRHAPGVSEAVRVPALGPFNPFAHADAQGGGH